VKLNSFLIWKYTVRWSIYAEIALLSGNVLFGNLRRRKKRRKIEILFDIMKNSILKTKFEMGKLYVLDNENLKLLNQFVKRKKIVVMEKVFDLWKEEISKNWKSRRKKPPDKKIMITFKILNRKELNQLKSKIRRSRNETKRNNNNEVRMMKEMLFKKVVEIIRNNQYLNEADVCYDAEKETKERLMKLQQYRSVVDMIDQTSELVKSEVDISCHGQVLVELSTESHGRNRNGCICNNKKTVAIKVFLGMTQKVANYNEKELSMDNDQFMKILMVNLKQDGEM
jgi:hypothetical protein